MHFVQDFYVVGFFPSTPLKVLGITVCDVIMMSYFRAGLSFVSCTGNILSGVCGVIMGEHWEYEAISIFYL